MAAVSIIRPHHLKSRDMSAENPIAGLAPEARSGVLLLLAAGLALFAANSPLASLYASFLDIPVVLQFGELIVAKPLLLWINDGLMAVFFFLIGLEVKREFLNGELSDPSKVAFPAAAAVGGMAVPAGLFAWFNMHDPAAMTGWAIPMATDIAFALGLLAMMGDRVPTSLKVFLLTLAIFDDLGAIIVIAIFYSADISLMSLLVAALALTGAVILNRRGVTGISGYALLGVVMWIAILKSGVHATLAGVAMAMTIPLRTEQKPTPLERLEDDLHAPVVFVILPLFAFANAGLALNEIGMSDLTHHVTLGIVVGLVVGKLVGVFGFAWLATMVGLAKKPDDASWTSVLGVAALCGVGFTMSLFIAGLAYEHGDAAYFMGDRLGILLGSTLSAVVGMSILHLSLRTAKP
jgi:Na+:H+ antiporter, NhaA family